jgi:hypothetical protein
MTHPTKPINILQRILLTLIIALACQSAPTPASAHPHQHGEEPHGPAIHPISVDQMQTVALSNPTGSDPLTLNEISAAKTVATNSTQMQAIQLRAASVIRPSQMAKLSTVQPLYVERHDEDKDAPVEARRADVFYYDYANDEAFVQVVNLKTGQVDLVNTLAGNPLPITSAETEAALQLILDHPRLGRALRDMTFQAIGLPLDAAWQIQAQGVPFFVASALDTPLEKITAICEYHRCAQLFIPFNDSTFIDTSNLVVDLSAGQLLWLDQGLQLHINSTPVNPGSALYFPLIFR